jgi:hypothetical protein
MRGRITQGGGYGGKVDQNKREHQYIIFVVDNNNTLRYPPQSPRTFENQATNPSATRNIHAGNITHSSSPETTSLETVKIPLLGCHIQYFLVPKQ